MSGTPLGMQHRLGTAPVGLTAVNAEDAVQRSLAQSRGSRLSALKSKSPRISIHTSLLIVILSKFVAYTFIIVSIFSILNSKIGQ
jgi:hypothetical protein